MLGFRSNCWASGLAVGPQVTYCRVRVTEPPSDSWEGRGGAEVGEEMILAKELVGNVLFFS